MDALKKLLEMRHSTTSIQHPQAGGLVEKMNQTIKTSLTAYVETDPTLWDEKLPFVTFANNTAVQASTNKFPFEIRSDHSGPQI